MVNGHDRYFRTDKFQNLLCVKVYTGDDYSVHPPISAVFIIAHLPSGNFSVSKGNVVPPFLCSLPKAFQYMIEIIVGDEIDTKIENSLTVETKINNSLAKGYLALIEEEKGDKK